MCARLSTALCVCLCVVSMATAQTHRADREDVVVIRAGQIITGTGAIIDDGSIVVVDGRISAVGRAVEYPRTARVIDARDQVVMPGFIHARTRLGLPAYSRNGSKAHLKAADEVYLELIDFDELIRYGCTSVAFIPAGSGIPGHAAVYRTAGPEEHRTLRETAYLRVTMTTLGRDKATLRDALQAAQAAIDKEKAARAEWDKKAAEEAQKKAEQQKADAERPKPEGESAEKPADGKPEEAPKEFTPPPIPAPLRPLIDLIHHVPGTIALIEVNSASALLHAEEVLGRHDNLAVMFHLQPGVGDFHHVVDRLGERKALVLTGPEMARLPSTVVRYNLVADLVRAGADVAIAPSGSLETLRPQLADLVRSGLSEADAIRAITINPARVARVDDQLGTIEVGKHADLIFLDSHPLDGHSKVIRTMIRGETVWSSGD